MLPWHAFGWVSAFLKLGYFTGCVFVFLIQNPEIMHRCVCMYIIYKLQVI